MRKLNTPGVWRHVHYRRWRGCHGHHHSPRQNAYLLRRGLWKSHQFWSQVFQDSCRISSVSKNRRHLWLQTIKRADWDNTTIKEARVGSAHFIVYETHFICPDMKSETHFISGHVKVIFIIPFCLLKLESLDCMNSFLYVKLCKLIVL